jgi:hypothetical protein
MRTRLCALLTLVLLLAPLPALGAPESAELEARAPVIDAFLERFGDTLSRLFGADEGDQGHGVDPSGLVAPEPPGPPDGEPARRDRGEVK